LTGHELKHAYQFEVGQISISAKNAGYGSLYDVTDETAAISRERSLGFTSQPLVQMVLSVAFFGEWNDQKTLALGRTMTPPAYQSLHRDQLTSIQCKE